MFDNQSHQSVSSADIEAEIARLVWRDQTIVSKAAQYHFSAGGARTRARMGLEAALGLGLSGQAALACALAPELLHNASLVHDDLQDGDTMRRHKPSVWAQYGKDVAISTGDLLISAAYRTIAMHPHPAPALCAMHDAIATTIRGQARDCGIGMATPEDHDSIAADKSGPLLALPVQLALIAAGIDHDEEAIRAGRAIAIAYQTLDDLSDRVDDQIHGVTNICLSLEATGLSADAAARTACARASAALDTARRHIGALPRGAGAPFLKLATRLDTQLKEFRHAA
jgi:geranylgeranyl diphosphate synthase type I